MRFATALVTLAMLSLSAKSAAAFHTQYPTCDSLSSANDCGTQSCWVSDTLGELGIRRAVQHANYCSNQPKYVARNIYIAEEGQFRNIYMQNTAASSQGIADCNGLGLPSAFANSICISGHHITISGGGDLFTALGNFAYSVCDSDVDNTPPALFVVYGYNNVLKDFRFAYWQEGIQVFGAGNRLTRLASSIYCDEAITINENAQNTIVEEGQFAGGGCPTCGKDKAIQVNGGSSTIWFNRFFSARKPIQINHGDHSVWGNKVVGATPGTGDNPDDKCMGFQFGEANNPNSFPDVYAFANSIDLCKWGIIADGSATVYAKNNHIRDAYQAAFSIRQDASLKAEGNKIIGAGFFNESDCLRGGLVFEDTDDPGDGQVDFGGGDCNVRARRAPSSFVT